MSNMRKRIYIACPISKGDLLHNIRQADNAHVALMRAGYAPFNPALSSYLGSCKKVLAEPVLHEGYYAQATPLPMGTTHEDWMDMDLPWVAVSDGVLRLPGESVGADQETEFATKKKIPVFYNIEQINLYFQTKEKIAKESRQKKKADA